MARHEPAVADFNQFRGIYRRCIPTYSIPVMLEAAAELGVSTERVLWSTGLLEEQVRSDDTLLSYLQAYKIVRNIIRESHLPEIGLRIGQRYHISTYGALGYAMMSCATWEEAMRLGARFYQVASSLVHLELEEGTDSLAYVATPYYPALQDIEVFCLEKLFASLVAITDGLLQHRLRPLQISFTFDKPAWAAQYMDYFGCPLEFNAPRNRFQIDAEQLQQPLLAANSVAAEMGRNLCEQRLRQIEDMGSDLQQKVSNLILAHPGQLPGMEDVARMLGTSSRNLRRRLTDEGTSYQILLDEVRHDLAKRYLQRSKLSLEEISSLVGYTESTNFRRAFRRWEGMPPAHYRRQYALQRE